MANEFKVKNGIRFPDDSVQTTALVPGLVSEVNGTGTVSGITLTGTVTTTGNLVLGGDLVVTASDFDSQTANTFLAAPDGSAGVPTFRTILASDVPTLNQNTTGTASNVTGTVAIANGGTGATDAPTARTNLGLGTIATQNSNSVTITGGSINGASVGATTRSTGAFTTLTANEATTLTAGTASTTTGTGTLVVTGGVGVSGNVYAGALYGPLTGNVTGTASAALAWQTARTITLAGDVTGNVSIDGSSNVTLTSTLSSSSNVTFNNLTLSGNLTVNGSTSTVNTTNLTVTDSLIELNTGVASNANDSGIIIERGSTGDNAIFAWDESADRFVLGTTLATGASSGDLTITVGSLQAEIVGNVSGTAANVTGTVAVANGGTGATDAANARTNLGVAIGSNVQAWDANLDQIAVLTPTADNFIVGNGTSWILETPAQVRTSLGLVVGTDVQAWDVNLDQIAALTPTADNFIVGNGTAWIVETPADARTSLGLGTIATQNAATVAITGGTINGTSIGATTASTGAFTTLTSNGATTMTANTASTSTTTGTVVVTGGVGVSGNIYAGAIQNTPIGSDAANTGAFTTLSATGAVTLSPANLAVTLSPTGTGVVTINPATLGTINNMSIGATTRSTGSFTTLTSSGATTMTANTASTSTTTGTLVVTGGVGVSGNVYVGGTMFGTASQALYADLAENYLADAEYKEGTVLIFGGDKEVTATNKIGDRRVAGVVSAKPAYLMNMDLEGQHVVAIALQGRVPVRVVGPVQKGDTLVTSDVFGYAMASEDPKPGTIIGKSLENKTSLDTGIVEAVVGKH